MKPTPCLSVRLTHLAELFEAGGVHGHVGGDVRLVARLVRLRHLLVARAGGGVHGLPLLAQHLGDLRELEVGVRGVDLGARHLHEAHVRALGALGLVGVHHVLALAAALLLAVLALLVLLGLLAGLGGGGFCWSLVLKKMKKWNATGGGREEKRVERESREWVEGMRRTQRGFVAGGRR